MQHDRHPIVTASHWNQPQGSVTNLDVFKETIQPLAPDFDGMQDVCAFAGTNQPIDFENNDIFRDLSLPFSVHEQKARGAGSIEGSPNPRKKSSMDLWMQNDFGNQNNFPGSHINNGLLIQSMEFQQPSGITQGSFYARNRQVGGMEASPDLSLPIKDSQSFQFDQPGPPQILDPGFNSNLSVARNETHSRFYKQDQFGQLNENPGTEIPYKASPGQPLKHQQIQQIEKQFWTKQGKQEKIKQGERGSSHWSQCRSNLEQPQITLTHKQIQEMTARNIQKKKQSSKFILISKEAGDQKPEMPLDYVNRTSIRGERSQNQLQDHLQAKYEINIKQEGLAAKNPESGFTIKLGDAQQRVIGQEKPKKDINLSPAFQNRPTISTGLDDRHGHRVSESNKAPPMKISLPSEKKPSLQQKNLISINLGQHSNSKVQQKEPENYSCSDALNQARGIVKIGTQEAAPPKISLALNHHKTENADGTLKINLNQRSSILQSPSEEKINDRTHLRTGKQVRHPEFNPDTFKVDLFSTPEVPDNKFNLVQPNQNNESTFKIKVGPEQKGQSMIQIPKKDVSQTTRADDSKVQNFSFSQVQNDVLKMDLTSNSLGKFQINLEKEPFQKPMTIVMQESVQPSAQPKPTGKFKIDMKADPPEKPKKPKRQQKKRSPNKEGNQKSKVQASLQIDISKPTSQQKKKKEEKQAAKQEQQVNSVSILTDDFQQNSEYVSSANDIHYCEADSKDFSSTKALYHANQGQCTESDKELMRRQECKPQQYNLTDQQLQKFLLESAQAPKQFKPQNIIQSLITLPNKEQPTNAEKETKNPEQAKATKIVLSLIDKPKEPSVKLNKRDIETKQPSDKKQTLLINLDDRQQLLDLSDLNDPSLSISQQPSPEQQPQDKFIIPIPHDVAQSSKGRREMTSKFRISLPQQPRIPYVSSAIKESTIQSDAGNGQHSYIQPIYPSFQNFNIPESKPGQEQTQNSAKNFERQFKGKQEEKQSEFGSKDTKKNQKNKDQRKPIIVNQNIQFDTFQVNYTVNFNMDQSKFNPDKQPFFPGQKDTGPQDRSYAPKIRLPIQDSTQQPQVLQTADQPMLTLPNQSSQDLENVSICASANENTLLGIGIEKEEKEFEKQYDMNIQHLVQAEQLGLAQKQEPPQEEQKEPPRQKRKYVRKQKKEEDQQPEEGKKKRQRKSAAEGGRKPRGKAAKKQPEEQEVKMIEQPLLNPESVALEHLRRLPQEEQAKLLEFAKAQQAALQIPQLVKNPQEPAQKKPDPIPKDSRELVLIPMKSEDIQPENSVSVDKDNLEFSPSGKQGVSANDSIMPQYSRIERKGVFQVQRIDRDIEVNPSVNVFKPEGKNPSLIGKRPPEDVDDDTIFQFEPSTIKRRISDESLASQQQTKKKQKKPRQPRPKKETEASKKKVKGETSGRKKREPALGNNSSGRKQPRTVDDLTEAIAQGMGLGSNSGHQLVQCEKFPKFDQQPFRVYITFEVQLLMYIHSYLSKHEVIGMLGGQVYQSIFSLKNEVQQPIKYIVINKIYPSESCISKPEVRLKNCEISDEEQIRISNQIEKDGVQKLAWYHSHPVFEVDPSIQDIATHYNWQMQFDKSGLPFFGVIVGPYNPKQEVTNTLFNVFNLKEESSLPKQQQKIAQLKDRVKSYHHRVIPRTKLNYSIYDEIKKMIKHSAGHKFDRPPLDQDWTNRRSRDKQSYFLKFMLSLKAICKANLTLQSEFNLEQEIKSLLENETDKLSLESQLLKTEANALRGKDQDPNAVNTEECKKPDIRSQKIFSISDEKKIEKFMFKIEQQLIKAFDLNQGASDFPLQQQQQQLEIPQQVLQLQPAQVQPIQESVPVPVFTPVQQPAFMDSLLQQFPFAHPTEDMAKADVVGQMSDTE